MVSLLVQIADAHSAWRLYFVQLEYNRAIIRFFLMIAPPEWHCGLAAPATLPGVRALGPVGTVVNP